MTKRYYSIRFERSDSYHQSGEQVLNADNPLRIGQTESCDIRLDNTSQYEDAVLAVIEKRSDNEGWKLVRLSPFKEHEVRVNGTPIDYVCFLNSGDRIAFEGQLQELSFDIRDDGQYNNEGIVSVQRGTTRPLLAWLILLTVLLSGFVGYAIYNSNMERHMIVQAKQSVFKIKVDSVSLIITQDGIIIDQQTEPVYDINGKTVVGTAFLTTDGKLVTARHCIQPWLNYTEEALSTPEMRTSDMKMAMEAITRNILTEYGYDSVWCDIVTYCSLTKPEQSGDSVILVVSSSDFVLDDSRDEIMQCGDFSQQFFWHSITVRPRRIDMMLGDIAYLPNAQDLLPGYKGTIRPASKSEMYSLCKMPQLGIIFMGRTTTDIGNQQVESSEAKMSASLSDTDFDEYGFPKIVLSHKGSITPGFSGGPVLARYGKFGWRAIGIVSVKDKHDSNRFYSVPVTEIERMTENQKRQEP